MKVKKLVHIYFEKFSWEEQGKYAVYSWMVDNSNDRIYIKSQEMEIEVPDDFDPRPQQIAALEAKKAKAMAQFHETVMQINEEISKLQALEYTA